MQVITNSMPPQMVEVEEPPVSPTAIKIKTEYTPLLRYDLLQLGNSNPKVMGYGGVGTVVETGIFRSPKLLNQRVLFLNPSGTFQQFNYPLIPLYCFQLPDTVDSFQATALIGGADIAMVLKNKLKQLQVDEVILLGANSVVGLSLIQLLAIDDPIPIQALVREQSQAYFNHQLALANLSLIRGHGKRPVVIDLSNQGYLTEINEYLKAKIPVWSIARNQLPGVKFISEPLLPKGYQELIELLAMDKLYLPIDKTFRYQAIDEAIAYQQAKSRGRNLLSWS